MNKERILLRQLAADLDARRLSLRARGTAATQRGPLGHVLLSCLGSTRFGYIIDSFLLK